VSRQFAASTNRRFKFHKCRQLLIRTHNETLSVVAVCVSNQIVRPLESIAESQPQLQPALLRLPAMISLFLGIYSCRIMADQSEAPPAADAQSVSPSFSDA
jgi:hypothetical protein